MKPLVTLALVASIYSFGCQSKPKPVMMPATPISADALASLRAAFIAGDPTARLGSVDEVRPVDMFLSVGQVTAADFPVGSACAIIDSSRAVIANGEVVRAFADRVHVRYEAKGIRVPQVGDVAVHFVDAR